MMRPPDADDVEAHAAIALHERLAAWLAEVAPDVPPLVVITALTYEIGRRAGGVLDQADDDTIEAMLDSIKVLMRQHVRWYRDGLQN